MIANETGELGGQFRHAELLQIQVFFRVAHPAIGMLFSNGSSPIHMFRQFFLEFLFNPGDIAGQLQLGEGMRPMPDRSLELTSIHETGDFSF